MAEILVVEDDESVFTLLETNLLIKGHEVVSARTGADCIEMLDKKTPNLVVLDIMLPDADGFELLDHIRSRPETEHIPVLILTARSDERDRVRGFAAGADDYLVKPFFSTELLLRIDRLLNTAATGSSLRRLALNDQITGLGNRSFFETRLEQLRARAEQEDLDLVLFVVDLPGLPEQVRKKGWKTADMALAKLGSALGAAIRGDEEGFWLGTQCVVTSLEIDSGARARSRLDELKGVVKASLESHRRQISLIPYFGYCFYEPPETSADLLDKLTRAPYGTVSQDAPRQPRKRSSEEAIEASFGGKLTGLAPVDYVPEQSGRRRRLSGEPKMDRRLAMDQMRQVAASLEAAVRGSSGVTNEKVGAWDTEDSKSANRDRTRTSGPIESGVQKIRTQPIAVDAVAPALPRLQETQVASALQEMLDEASSAPHDVAVCCLSFEGSEEARARHGGDSVDSLLDGIAFETAGEVGLDRLQGAQAFWTGDHLLVAVPRASVADARSLAESLAEIASTKLSPHRLNLKISAIGGYVFFEFDESAGDLFERAKQSPYKGGVLVTPLEARRRDG